MNIATTPAVCPPAVQPGNLSAAKHTPAIAPPHPGAEPELAVVAVLGYN